MAKKKVSKKKQENKGSALGTIGKGLWFLMKTPYYIGKGIYKATKYTADKVEESSRKKQVKQKREQMIPFYENFKIVHTKEGNYLQWEEGVNKSDSKIGVIIGARGTGKTAFGMKFLENSRAKTKKKCYAMGFNPDEMPNWITVVNTIEEIGNNSIILIDEGGILFNSRDSMSNANKLLSDLILIARHKNLTILFISQNSSNLDINILRQADFLILKPSSLLQKNFERKIIQKIYDDASEHFEEFKDEPGLTHIFSGDFNGFVSNPLPSFWGTNISKSFR
ncbi:MAG TPA: zonular occludens toxin domain-containing protein [Candidatus Nanoarchaeia archaeon]|nr:zonular occludens toxin domain-containing protein [Candidatus Nanoarchaeia archaeon]